MTAGLSIDRALGKTLDRGEFLHGQLEQAAPELMRRLLTTLITRITGTSVPSCRTQPSDVNPAV